MDSSSGAIIGIVGVIAIVGLIVILRLILRAAGNEQKQTETWVGDMWSGCLTHYMIFCLIGATIALVIFGIIALVHGEVLLGLGVVISAIIAFGIVYLFYKWLQDQDNITIRSLAILMSILLLVILFLIFKNVSAIQPH